MPYQKGDKIWVNHRGKWREGEYQEAGNVMSERGELILDGHRVQVFYGKRGQPPYSVVGVRGDQVGQTKPQMRSRAERTETSGVGEMKIGGARALYKKGQLVSFKWSDQWYPGIYQGWSRA